MNLNDSFLPQSLDIAFKYLKLSTLAAFINVVILFIVLYESISTVNLVTWLLFATIVTISRLVLLRFYLTKKSRFSIKKWETFFIVGVVFGASIWGLAPIILFDDSNVLHQAMLLFIIAGISAGSIASLSSHNKSVKLFLLIILVPLIIKLLSTNEEIHYYLSFLVFLFLLMMIHTAKIFYKNQISYIESQKELNTSNTYLKNLIENAPVGIFSYDKNLIVKEANNEFSNILQAPLDYLIGFDINTVSDKRILPAIQAAVDNMNGFYEGEYITKFNFLQKWVRIYTSPIVDENGVVNGALGITLDITDRMKMEKQYEYQAKYDELTDIPNRYTLMDRLSQELTRFKRHKIIFAVVFIDLDHFKNINDSFGHSVGDKLLVEVSQRLQNSVREGDIVARLGGDEFVLLLPDLSTQKEESARKAETIVNKVEDTLTPSFTIQNYIFDVTVSIGIALSSSQDKTADDVLKHADMAMYKAKKDGRNLNRFYEKSMDEYIQQRVKMEADLKNALKNGEFTLHFQPIVDVQSSKIIAAEALLRWNKDISISPGVFIPVAEEIGLILPVGEWVIENALKEFKNWKDLNLDIKKIAINISTSQFVENNFVDNLKFLIEKYDINPSAVELELTESVVIQDFDASKLKMNKLRELGISLSIDDFGTGYSSLSYLKHLPFNTLKIDKSFTNDILTDEDDKKLVSTMLMIASNLDLSVVAEGVEQSAQLDYLLEKKCDFYQGYFCSKPLNSKDFISFFSQHNKKNDM